MGKAGRKLSLISCDQSGIGLAAVKQFVNGLPSRRFSSATNGGSEISHICGHVRLKRENSYRSTCLYGPARA